MLSQTAKLKVHTIKWLSRRLLHYVVRLHGILMIYAYQVNLAEDCGSMQRGSEVLYVGDGVAIWDGSVHDSRRRDASLLASSSMGMPSCLRMVARCPAGACAQTEALDISRNGTEQFRRLFPGMELDRYHVSKMNDAHAQNNLFFDEK